MDAGLAPGGEVTVDFEGVARAALVGIDPVLACGEANTAKRHKALYRGEKHLASECKTHFRGLTKCS